MDRRMAIAGAIVCLLMVTPMVQSSCIPALFNFGDSTSDTGGIHASFPSSTPAESLPYGETYFGKAGVRYSDGRLLIDFVATALGLPFIDPYLQSVTSNFAHGANFATAGATVRSVTYLSPFNLGVQVKQWQQFYSNVVNTLANDPGNARLPQVSYFTDGLYTIALGGNDFTFGYTKGQSPLQIRSYLPLVINGITDAIRGIYRYAGRNFLIWDIEPQGCLPYTLTLISHTEADLDANGCLRDYNDNAIYFNGLLKTALTDLQNELTGSTIVLLSTYDLKTDLFANATANGFQFITRACCGVPSAYNYNTQVNCGSSGTVNGVTLTAVTCSDPSQYAVWDGVHNTEAANRYIAQQIFGGKYLSPAWPKLTDSCGLSPF
ncbi:hypothetical protein MPTK1_7g07250 [Marchantia polymorpha subsp. ruderalis]|uniref:GDSL esterase/lipase n=2 Tax=Marchantia polymorpha TaxID=3197 RepID=A0A176VNT9_MARPO|nr:hypothetical protein AXG93_1504s1270 [Marchantia polymorpha subsp. ruderalis]PTQ34835.1 hypothetical protein MARPO_0076s0069 [Marchantia polymorpha]BBN16543.1 hypothetical protein Mp_7g07250 [Marchantia polymorpha subsp. ruderalis]|eukprot:PTQ34835.1 hypothetical protein MARPO_0076s0069 [Marchantia polymorpha]